MLITDIGRRKVNLRSKLKTQFRKKINYWIKLCGAFKITSCTDQSNKISTSRKINKFRREGKQK
jgi:hypothetical protein